MVTKLRKFHAGPVRADTLNSELEKLLLSVNGDGRVIETRRCGQEVTVTLNIPALLALIPKLGGSLFIGNVEKDGGADGNLTTAATWTYTIRRISQVVATAVTQDRPRPKGTATFQAGSGGFGLCFYGSDGTVHLWDAGEIYGVGSCP